MNNLERVIEEIAEDDERYNNFMERAKAMHNIKILIPSYMTLTTKRLDKKGNFCEGGDHSYTDSQLYGKVFYYSLIIQQLKLFINFCDIINFDCKFQFINDEVKMNKIKTKSKWRKDLEQKIVFGLLLVYLSYYLIAGTKFGENKFFYVAREGMKSTLMKEYIVNLYGPNLKEYPDFNSDLILKAILNYQGPANYTYFRDYMRNLGLEEKYYLTLSK